MAVAAERTITVTGETLRNGDTIRRPGDPSVRFSVMIVFFGIPL
jgi:hypothetical protein